MSKTKIVLSAKELDMVNDSEWILRKQAIIQQVYVLLESVIEDVDTLLLPPWQSISDQQSLSPRIFKGENYLGLPYVTLDHPRFFESENTLTIRTMFWWGNFMSVTVHAGGMYKEKVLNKIAGLTASLRDGLYICIHESQWHHHFQTDNYVLLKDISVEQMGEIKTQRNFIKLAYKLSLQQFNELQHLLLKHYQMLAEILA